MGAEQKNIVAVSWVVALLIMAFWAPGEGLRVFWATSRHHQISKVALELVEPARTEYKRAEQKYFLEYGIYVPLEDIMYVEQLPGGGVRYGDALQRSCSGLQLGSGLAIWLPLRIKWPFFGERVIEWCWKPPVKRTN